MKMYNAAIEVDRHQRDAERQADELMDALKAYHPAVGISPRGWLEARISLPAENLTQATITALAVVEQATGAAALAAEVMTEEEFNAREGFDEIPELLGAAEAAVLLGVSRQRVDQLAAAGKIQAVPIGRNRGYVATSVITYRDSERKAGRPSVG